MPWLYRIGLAMKVTSMPAELPITAQNGSTMPASRYSERLANPRTEPSAAPTSTTANVWAVIGTGVPGILNEIWAAPGKTLSEHLGSIGPDVQIVSAALLNYVPTGLDVPLRRT